MNANLLRWVVVISAVGLSHGCKYYQYQPDTGLDRYQYKKFGTEEWRHLDKGFVLVLHQGTDTVEFYDLSFNEVENSLTGSIRPFEGLPYYHYKKAINSDKKYLKRPFAGVDGPATNQIHFYVDNCSKLDSVHRKFYLNRIERVDFMKQSGWNTAINLSLVAFIGVSTALFLGLVVIPAGYQ